MRYDFQICKSGIFHMTKIQNRALVTVALIFCAGLAGCALLPPSKQVDKPQGQGYGTIGFTYHRDTLHTYGHVEFYYWDEKGKQTLVWPTLSMFVPIGTDKALFKGYLIDGPSDPFPGTRGPLRLFAVQGAGPVMDITDDVVHLWLKASETNFLEVIQSKCQRVLKMEQNGNNFTFEVGVIGGGSGTVELTQFHLFDLIREAKEKGKPMKDPGIGTSYLKRDWEAELRE
jgi:hypothetical protein